MWQTWRFITPGLKATERRYIVPFVAASLVFFSAGMVRRLLQLRPRHPVARAIGGSTLITEYNPNQYLTLFLLMMFIFGVTFLFPVVLVALELANIVTPKQLLHVLALRGDRHHRRVGGLHPERRPAVDVGPGAYPSSPSTSSRSASASCCISERRDYRASIRRRPRLRTRPLSARRHRGASTSK